MFGQKDAFTDVASSLQQSGSQNNGNGGNNSNGGNSSSQPSGTAVGTSGETITLGLGNIKQK